MTARAPRRREAAGREVTDKGATRGHPCPPPHSCIHAHRDSRTSLSSAAFVLSCTSPWANAVGRTEFPWLPLQVRAQITPILSGGSSLHSRSSPRSPCPAAQGRANGTERRDARESPVETLTLRSFFRLSVLMLHDLSVLRGDPVLGAQARAVVGAGARAPQEARMMSSAGTVSVTG
jgi:hypothetical protein